jgi:hypothetical protein
LTAAETTRVGSSSWHAPHHGRADLRALFGHCSLQLALLVADGPKDDGGRVAIALDHRFKLRHAFRTGTHLAGLAHHHHAHAIAAFHPLRRGHVVRGAHGVAAHLAQHSQPEPLQPVRHRRAHSGVILVVAGALNLDGFAVEEESLVGVEVRGAHTKADALGIARLAVRFHGHNRRVEIRRIHRPQRFGLAVWRGRKVCGAITPIDCARSFGRGHGLAAASRICQLTFALSACFALIRNHCAKRESERSCHSQKRTVLSHLPRCSASVLVSHTCR